MDNNLILALLIIVILGLAAFSYAIWQQLKNLQKPEDSSGFQMLQNQLGQLSKMQQDKLERLEDQFQNQQKEMNEQLFRSQSVLQKQLEMSRKEIAETSQTTTKLVREVTAELTGLKETNKQVVGFAEQLQSFENLLRSPKQRGVLGEYFLQTVLESVLPADTFRLQHKFIDGEIVDAIIMTKDGNIPVDAKFSLSNYERLVDAQTDLEKKEYEKLFKLDLQKRIDETSKYVRSHEGTLDFAFMFIPADGLYYDLLAKKVGTLAINSEDLIRYAFKKKVLIVSPTTLFAYLQTVLQGLRALKIEESTKQIQANVAKLQKHLLAYQEYFGKVGNNLERSISAYNMASKELNKIDKDMIKITGDETMALDAESVTTGAVGELPLD